jgi:hypothetical protein
MKAQKNISNKILLVVSSLFLAVLTNDFYSQKESYVSLKENYSEIKIKTNDFSLDNRFNIIDSIIKLELQKSVFFTFDTTLLFLKFSKKIDVYQYTDIIELNSECTEIISLTGRRNGEFFHLFVLFEGGRIKQISKSLSFVDFSLVRRIFFNTEEVPFYESYYSAKKNKFINKKIKKINQEHIEIIDYSRAYIKKALE